MKQNGVWLFGRTMSHERSLEFRISHCSDESGKASGVLWFPTDQLQWKHILPLSPISRVLFFSHTVPDLLFSLLFFRAYCAFFEFYSSHKGLDPAGWWAIAMHTALKRCSRKPPLFKIQLSLHIFTSASLLGFWNKGKAIALNNILFPTVYINWKAFCILYTAKQFFYIQLIYFYLLYFR